MYIVLVNVPATEWCHRIDESRKVIGRARDSQIRLPAHYLQVSRAHAELWCDGSGGWIRDLNSSGGTKVNGVWLHGGRSISIKAGDRLTLCNVHFDLVAEVPPLADVLAETGIAAEPPSAAETHIKPASPSAAARSSLAMLSPAELDIVLCMSRGITDDNEIGRLLHRSPHTVRTQVGHILQKLELRSRISIVNWLTKASSASRRADVLDQATDPEIDVEAIHRRASATETEPDPDRPPS